MVHNPGIFLLAALLSYARPALILIVVLLTARVITQYA